MRISFGKLLLIITILYMTSCITEEPAPWNTDPVPVVFSIISPGKQVRVFVSETFAEQNSNNIDNSETKVFISNDNSNWYELTHDILDNSLFVDTAKIFNVEGGRSYYLKVEKLESLLTSQTTIPDTDAYIKNAECIEYYKDSTNQNILCGLKVNFTLTNNKNEGCYLEAFGKQLGSEPFITGDFYQDDYFFVPLDSAAFSLKLVTTDSHLNKFRISENINITQIHEKFDVNLIISTYAGVRPIFSNIKNGIGLFGSYNYSNYKVTVKQKNE